MTKRMESSDIYTYWDEEAQRSELHVKGLVLYGDPKTARAVMTEINRLIGANAALHIYILDISKTVNATLKGLGYEVAG